jgi:hypothetical protein
MVIDIKKDNRGVIDKRMLSKSERLENQHNFAIHVMEEHLTNLGTSNSEVDPIEQFYTNTHLGIAHQAAAVPTARPKASLGFSRYP